MIDAAVATKFGAKEADTMWLLVCAFLVFFMQCATRPPDPNAPLP